jgi:DNA-directed RNA polymerase specialized sigma24 family protein
MFRRRGGDSDLAWVYGAAMRACADERSAQIAARAAFATDGNRTVRAIAAVRFGLAESPCRALAELPGAEREAIGLARVLGMDVAAIATALGCDRADIKARMRAGLAHLARTGEVAHIA